MTRLFHAAQIIVFSLANRLPFIAFLLKKYYALGEFFFGLFSWLLPGIESCYVKQNNASQRVSYGLSDLDFVIVIKNPENLNARKCFFDQLATLVFILRIFFIFIERNVLVLDRDEARDPDAASFFLFDHNKPTRLRGQTINFSSNKALSRLLVLRKSIYSYFDLCGFCFSGFSTTRLIDIKRLLEKARGNFAQERTVPEKNKAGYRLKPDDLKQLLEDIRPSYKSFGAAKEIAPIKPARSLDQSTIQDVSYHDLKAALLEYAKQLEPLRLKGVITRFALIPLYHLHCYGFILVTPSFWEDPAHFQFLKKIWRKFKGRPILKFLKTGNPIPIEPGHLKIFQYIEPLDGWWPNLQGVDLETGTAYPEDAPNHVACEQDLLIRASLKFPYYWLNLFLSQKDLFTLLNFIAYRLPQGILYLKHRELYCGRDEIEAQFKRRYPDYTAIYGSLSEEARRGQNRNLKKILKDYGSFMEEMIRVIKTA